MSEGKIELDILSALEMVAFEALGDGTLKLISAVPSWFGDFFPDAEIGAPLRPQETFFFLAEFLNEAEKFWDSRAGTVLRSGVWSEVYSANKQYNLEASAILVGEHRWLVIARLRSAFGDIQALMQKARERNLDYDRLRQTQEALRASEERYRDLFE